jgi:CBS domain-containing protein
MLVREVMTWGTVTLRPDTTLRQAALMLLESGHTAIPVVNERDELVGMIGIRDLLTAPRHAYAGTRAHENRSEQDALAIWEQTRVAQVMADEVISVSEDASVMKAAAMMANMGIHPLPVVRGRQVVGVIGRRDIIKAVLCHSDAFYRPVA